MIDSAFFNNAGPFSLEAIAKLSNSMVHFPENFDKNAKYFINDVAPLDLATEREITVLNNYKYLNKLISSKALACFIEEKYISKAPKTMILLISENPYKSFALTASAFYPVKINSTATIGKNADIDQTAILGKNYQIGSNVSIGPNVRIGNNCTIGAGSFIQDCVAIGNDCMIGAGVTISHAIIGNNVLIHPGVRIGQDGFGFASDQNGHYKIPQLGRVIIGNNVEIGSNSCIDRGSLNDTKIGDGCFIDNLVQIAHNVELGKYCVIVAQVGISGSTTLGDFVVVGGQAGIAGHLNIGSGVRIAAKSGVIKDIKAKEQQGGYPALQISQWHRQTIALKKLIERGQKN